METEEKRCPLFTRAPGAAQGNWGLRAHSASTKLNLRAFHPQAGKLSGS